MEIQLKARNRDWTFELNDGETLLRAALRAGLVAPYECATGTCGSCKVTLTDGQVEDPWPQAPGRGDAQDVKLMCQCRPMTDCHVEAKGYVYSSDLPAVVPTELAARITRVTLLNQDVIELAVQTEQLVHYRAGQFALLEHSSIRGARGYSMTRYTPESDQFEFVIKRKPGGGWSEWLFREKEALVGEALKVTGPYGRADFTPDVAMNIACIAGGSGVAGMRAIVERAVFDGYFKQYRGMLFFGVRSPADAFWLKELNDLSLLGGEKLEITVAYSEVDPDAAQMEQYPALKFFKGYVHEAAAQGLKGRFNNLRAYLAGPPKAVDAAQRMLLIDGKLSPSNIRYDKFS